jgi:hypothetical protein
LQAARSFSFPLSYELSSVSSTSNSWFRLAAFVGLIATNLFQTSSAPVCNQHIPHPFFFVKRTSRGKTSLYFANK